jgi:hypothetical protein
MTTGANVIPLGAQPPIFKVMEDAVYARWRELGWYPNPEQFYPVNARFDFSNPASVEALMEHMRLEAIAVAYARLKAVDPKRTQQVRVSVRYTPGASPSMSVVLSLESASNRVTTYI